MRRSPPSSTGRVSSDEEPAFRSTLEGLLAEFAHVPGASGSLVFRREAGGEVEFSILQRFATEKDHAAWLASAGFARWRAAVAPSTPTPDHVHRYSGMDAFFVDARAPDAPPRWNMAVVLLVAVYPMSLAVAHWLAPALARVSLFTGALITSVIMVVSMTWLVVLAPDEALRAVADSRRPAIRDRSCSAPGEASTDGGRRRGRCSSDSWFWSGVGVPAGVGADVGPEPLPGAGGDAA